MKTANYYPKQDRLDFISSDGQPTGGIFGDVAHLKAAYLLAGGHIVVINLSSKN